RMGSWHIVVTSHQHSLRILSRDRPQKRRVGKSDVRGSGDCLRLMFAALTKMGSNAGVEILVDEQPPGPHRRYRGYAAVSYRLTAWYQRTASSICRRPSR